MGKLIRFDADARRALWRGVDQLASAVRITLGPRGRNVVLDRAGSAPTITNDGLAIAREIELENPFENMGVQMLKEVALKTGEVAGDGTTTATVLAHRLVGAGLQAIEAGHNPMAVKRGIDRAVAAVVEELRRQSRTVTDRADMARVATVAANDDPVLGSLIADALERIGRHGVVLVEEGRGFETTLELVEGVRLDRGYLSPYFVTDPEQMAAVLDRPLVMLVDEKLTLMLQVAPAMEHAAKAGRPLLVIAEDVEGEALATLVVNRLRGAVQSVAVRAPESGERRREQLEDLAILTGARLYAPDLGLKVEQFEAADFGRAQRVVVDQESATVVEGGGRAEEIRRRIRALERELAGCDSDFDRERLRGRLARLGGGIAVIHVGAPSELAMNERRSRIEDALAATRSAVEEGVVSGGGVALVRARGAVLGLELARDEDVGRSIVLAALDEPARQIAHNAGEPGAVVVDRVRRGSGSFGFNAATGEFGDLEAAGILDPTKVTRCALQHAASIGSLMITTEAIVVDAPAPEPDGEQPGPPES